jgi:hypothetical protein
MRFWAASVSGWKHSIMIIHIDITIFNMNNEDFERLPLPLFDRPLDSAYRLSRNFSLDYLGTKYTQ